MLIPKYWSPKYFKDKLMVILYETIKPRDPWLVKEANLFLDKHLNHTHNLLEFGAGKSTLWFSPRVKNIISFEHNPKWHQKIANKISTNKLINIDYRLSTPNTYTYEINKLHKNFDVILIDSILRDVCAVEAIKHLKKGGIIILDDAQRYLPYGSKVPETIYFGPTPSKKWGEFIRATSKWKTLYFSNGVWDTAIFIKP